MCDFKVHTKLWLHTHSGQVVSDLCVHGDLCRTVALLAAVLAKVANGHTVLLCDLCMCVCVCVRKKREGEREGEREREKILRDQFACNLSASWKAGKLCVCILFKGIVTIRG